MDFDCEFVKYERDEKVGIVTIAHPPVNSLSPQVVSELETVLKGIQENPEIHAVVLTGEGPKIFVAGADIKAMAGMTPAEAEDLAHNGQSTLNRLQNMPKLTICAMNGLALGGGLELAMACDMRLAVPHAKMGQPEINLGIIPGFGGTQRLPRIIGIGRAMEMLLTGDPISAAQAADWGLVNRVVEADKLMEEALSIAKKAASKGPLATQFIQNAVYEGIEKSLAQGLRQEAKEFGEVFKTEDKDEGIKAFIEKRVPDFKGK